LWIGWLAWPVVLLGALPLLREPDRAGVRETEREEAPAGAPSFG